MSYGVRTSSVCVLLRREAFQERRRLPHFTPISPSKEAQAAMGVDSADCDGDGTIDRVLTLTLDRR
jgi:hypothetical protein